MLDLAMTGHTAGWPIVDILAARKFNDIMGGALIAPWQVQQIPDEWIEAATLLRDGMPKMQAGLSEIEATKASIRSQHPTYRKTRH